MLNLFGGEQYDDPALGSFTFKDGRWVGVLTLPPHGTVALRLSGGRKAPDPESLETAKNLPAQYAALKTQVAGQLFEHYEPGWEAWSSGEREGFGDEFPEMKSAAEVWSNVRVEYVDIDYARRDYQVEIRLATTWDEEHTLGVRLAGGRLVELCGSVGP